MLNYSVAELRFFSDSEHPVLKERLMKSCIEHIPINNRKRKISIPLYSIKKDKKEWSIQKG